MGIVVNDEPPDSPTESAEVIASVRRLASLASPGETLVRTLDALTSGDLKSRLTPVDTSEWDDAPEFADAYLFSVNWQDQVATRVVKVLTPDRQVTRVSKLRLRWRNRHLVLSPDSGELSLGRGADMDITIDSEFASRDHARIRCQGSAFILADVSTNGTYVNLDDSVVFIRDDEVILRGQGWISLGKHASESLGKVLYFSSETSAP
nr:FHA domain-containing protein [Thiorhodococcus mannitoliphagus]